MINKILNKIKYFIKHSTNYFTYKLLNVDESEIYIIHPYTTNKQELDNCEVLIERTPKTPKSIVLFRREYNENVHYIVETYRYFGIFKINKPIKIKDALTTDKYIPFGNNIVYFESEYYCNRYILELCNLRHIRLSDIKVYNSISNRYVNLGVRRY